MLNWSVDFHSLKTLASIQKVKGFIVTYVKNYKTVLITNRQGEES
ncbi:hypothetical protein SAMD00020551_2054 [Mesobacillus selenatarsenatis SF-1]|uniref:Uncharacterized protein n=1 Tax=Mesobacillus selenatarsenatis (strain DSM 18680 / JCM 14380 / FERM P-15431 / SF-1) TaxID=1321606 RepID=A0A0A8X4I4_MESS1|nr:hypothetical protein SAMD00020551_2054 [Mesobacillus selenatarsenatis SF-1]